MTYIPKIKFLDGITWVWELLFGIRTRSELNCAAARKKETEEYLDYSKQLRILDLGNGRLRPQFSILCAENHRVDGVDLANDRKFNLTNLAYFFFRLIFSLWLGPRAWKKNNGTLHYSSAETMPFADNSFDLVTSVAAFEHFLNTPAVLKEIKRVLKPGGIIWINLHCFTCLSGGHNLTKRLSALDHVSDKSLLWDHLREKKLPFDVPLNEWRNCQYIDAFKKEFTVVQHRCTGVEGENLLSEEIHSFLKEYSRQELLCNNYTIVAHCDK